MEQFTFGSPEYQTYLEENSHTKGEKEFLESIAQEGMIAVDVGGNHGYAAIALGKFIGRIGTLYCFEPVPEFSKVLVSNIEGNALTNVELLPYAVGNEEKEIRIYKDNGATRIIPIEEKESVVTKMIRLDDFFLSRKQARLDLLNMDCEGSELFVLQGAERLLRNNQTEVFLEIHHKFLAILGYSVHTIVDFLKGIGYSVSSVSLSDLHQSNEYEDCEYLYAHK